MKRSLPSPLVLARALKESLPSGIGLARNFVYQAFAHLNHKRFTSAFQQLIGVLIAEAERRGQAQQLEEGEKVLEEAVRIVEQERFGCQPRLKRQVYWAFGLFYVKAGLLHQAIDSFNKQLAQLQPGKSPDQELALLARLRDVYSQLKDYKKAARCSLRAVKLSQKLIEHDSSETWARQAVQALVETGIIYEKSGDCQLSRKYLGLGYNLAKRLLQPDDQLLLQVRGALTRKEPLKDQPRVVINLFSDSQVRLKLGKGKYRRRENYPTRPLSQSLMSRVSQGRLRSANARSKQNPGLQGYRSQFKDTVESDFIAVESDPEQRRLYSQLLQRYLKGAAAVLLMQGRKVFRSQRVELGGESACVQLLEEGDKGKVKVKVEKAGQYQFEVVQEVSKKLLKRLAQAKTLAGAFYIQTGGRGICFLMKALAPEASVLSRIQRTFRMRKQRAIFLGQVRKTVKLVFCLRRSMGGQVFIISGLAVGTTYTRFIQSVGLPRCQRVFFSQRVQRRQLDSAFYEGFWFVPGVGLVDRKHYERNISRVTAVQRWGRSLLSRQKLRGPKVLRQEILADPEKVLVTLSLAGDGVGNLQVVGLTRKRARLTRSLTRQQLGALISCQRLGSSVSFSFEEGQILLEGDSPQICVEQVGFYGWNQYDYGRQIDYHRFCPEQIAQEKQAADKIGAAYLSNKAKRERREQLVQIREQNIRAKEEKARQELEEKKKAVLVFEKQYSNKKEKEERRKELTRQREENMRLKQEQQARQLEEKKKAVLVFQKQFSNKKEKQERRKELTRQREQNLRLKQEQKAKQLEEKKQAVLVFEKQYSSKKEKEERRKYLTRQREQNIRLKEEARREAEQLEEKKKAVQVFEKQFVFKKDKQKKREQLTKQRQQNIRQKAEAEAKAKAEIEQKKKAVQVFEKQFTLKKEKERKREELTKKREENIRQKGKADSQVQAQADLQIGLQVHAELQAQTNAQTKEDTLQQKKKAVQVFQKQFALKKEKQRKRDELTKKREENMLKRQQEQEEYMEVLRSHKLTLSEEEKSRRIEELQRMKRERQRIRRKEPAPKQGCEEEALLEGMTFELASMLQPPCD